MGETDIGESSTDRTISLLGGNVMVELDDFEMRELTVDELVEPLHALGSGDWTGVIIDLSHKHIEVDQVNRDKAALKAVNDPICNCT